MILEKIIKILDMRYLAYVANFSQDSCVAVSITKPLKQYTACICNTYYM